MPAAITPRASVAASGRPPAAPGAQAAEAKRGAKRYAFTVLGTTDLHGNVFNWDYFKNAEYDDAKNEQAMLEHRIAQLEERLLAARVIEKKEILKDAVSIGSRVKLRDVAAKKTFEYHIVGSAEANPAENKLSNESPVGKAIMGKKKGETVEVSTPRGSLKYKILELKT